MTEKTAQVAYLHLHFPLEIALACNATPVRLFGKTPPYSKVDSHLQTYCCSLARGVLEDWLEGAHKRFAAVVFTHSCDTLQRLEAIMRLTDESVRVLPMQYPLNKKSEGAPAFLAANIRKAFDELRELVPGAPKDDAEAAKNFLAAVRMVEKARKAANELMALHAEGRIGYGATYDVLIRGEKSFDSQFLAELEAAVATAKTAAPKSRKNVAIYGGAILNNQLPQLFDKLNLGVCVDYSSTGGLFYAKPAAGVDAETAALDGAPLDDVIMYIAKKELAKTADPTSLSSRLDSAGKVSEFIDAAKAGGAAGVIFAYLKFCEPWGFDVPAITEGAKAAGMPSLVLEYENSSELPGQTITRLEAFAELLG